MLFGRKLKVVTKITKQYQALYEEKQAENSILTNVFDTNFSLPFRIGWLIIIITAFSFCSYQCYERMAHFKTKPIKVNANIEEKLVDDFPALHLTSLVTDEFTAYYSARNSLGKQACSQALRFLMDDHTSLRKVMELKNFTKMIKTIHFKRGRKAYDKLFDTKEIYSLFSTMTRIESIKKVSIGPEAKLVIETQIANNYNSRRSMLPIFITAKNYIFSFTATAAVRLGHLYSQNEISFTSRKYSFLNRKSSPCVNISVMEDCHEKCYLVEIKRQNFTCQFPFLPKEIDEECISNKLTCDYTRTLGQIRIKVNPPYLCNCLRECEKTVITSHYNFDEHRTKRTIFYSYSNWILKLKEYYSYDFIALLCDVGGYLSLYTGISCIAIVKLFFHDITETVRKLLFSVQKSRFEVKIISKIEKIMLKRKLRARKQNQQNVKQIEKIKIILILMSFILCCYLIYVQAVDYFGFPVYVTIILAQDRYVQPPTIVFCSDNADLYEMKEKFLNDTRSNASHTSGNVKCVEDVDILDLLDQFENDAEELWKATGDIENYEFVVAMGEQFGKDTALFVPNFGNRSYLDTVFGKCIKVETGSVEYNPVTAVHHTGFAGEGIRCNSHSKIFLMKSEDKIDFLTYNIHPHDVGLTMKFSRQTLDKLNTPTNPCTSLEKFKMCEEDCVNTKMEKEDINCRLPFLNSTNLPMCKTPADAKPTRRSYIKVHANNYALRDCNCRPPCYHTIYTSLIDYSIANEKLKLVITTYEFDSNIREIFKEELSMPFIKLLGNIGSILGFFLGLSILLCFQLLEMFVRCIKSRLT